MKLNDLEKGVPVELTGILGDEALEVDAEPLDLEPLIEGMTGVSLSPYSQQKLMLSHQNVGTSDRGDLFSDIFGDDAPAQSDFLKSSGAGIPIDLVPALASVETMPIQTNLHEGFADRVIERFVAKVKLLANQHPEGTLSRSPNDIKKRRDFFKTVASMFEGGKASKGDDANNDIATALKRFKESLTPELLSSESIAQFEAEMSC